MTNKTVFRRQAIRAAVKIHEYLRGPARRANGLALPQSAWEELCRTAKYYRYAERKGWHAAGQSLLQDVHYAALRLQREIENLRQTRSGGPASKLAASAREMASELFALEDEFEDVKIDLKSHSVSALTTGIELEGVYLGSFRIVLTWPRIGEAEHPYHVYAQEPYHPDSREDVSHPHVMDHRLCEGDGATAIKAALSAGRLYDFFVLVRQILSTYNPESAYVSLEDWNGSISCAGCGTSMSEDDYSTCERCDERICSDCSWRCSDCGDCICSSCSRDCAECGERFCNDCLTTPANSTNNLCEKCLNKAQQEKDRPNDNSHETPADEPTSTPPQSLSTPAAAPDPLCVGQAAPPARPRRNGSRTVRRQPSARPATRRRRASRAARV